ncbi:MAG: hypothetical protein ACRCXN_07010 [Bacteroidales bacterium]
METPLFFKNQKKLNARMYSDFTSGAFNTCFNEYLNWKFNHSDQLDLSLTQIHSLLLDIAVHLNAYELKYPNANMPTDIYINNDPWQLYAGYAKDKYMVSYLEKIEDELIRMLPLFK